MRRQEMEKTLKDAKELTEQGRGKHHIGDFLPPDELTKFLKKVTNFVPIQQVPHQTRLMAEVLNCQRVQL